jgi:hypothetical protein
MTIRFSRAEYWLLDVAVQDVVPIADLISGDAAGGLNRTDHQCIAEELAEALERLFADRLITSFRCEGRRRYRTLTLSEIHGEMRRPKNPPKPDDPYAMPRRHPDEAFYRLTPQGGAAWETFARPDWNLFIDGVGTTITSGKVYPPFPTRGYAICPTRRQVERYLEMARQIGHQVDSSSIRWDVVAPWKATYWKVLPARHRVRYKMVYDGVHHDNRDGVPTAEDVFALSRSWYRWRS